MLKQMGKSSKSYSFYFSQYIYVGRGAYGGCHLNLRYGIREDKEQIWIDNHADPNLLGIKQITVADLIFCLGLLLFFSLSGNSTF